MSSPSLLTECVPLFEGDAAALALEAAYRTRDLVEQRARVLAWLAPQPSERIVDVGCGPGLLAEALARAVGPEGSVLAVDRAESMVGLATTRCAFSPRVVVKVSDACALPAADASHDALVCTQVLEYVPDVPAALREFARVLRPGARVLLMDTDWESCVWHSDDDARMRLMLAAWDTHCPHPRLPRTLAPLLADAGFANVAVEVHAIVTHTRKVGSFGASMETTLARHAVRTGQVSDATASAWQADLAAQDAAGRYFFSLNRHVFIARRG